MLQKAPSRKMAKKRLGYRMVWSCHLCECFRWQDRCLRCAQESLSSTIPTQQRRLLALQLFPTCSAKEEQLRKAGGTSGREDEPSLWIPQCSGRVSLSLGFCLGKRCLAAIKWEGWLCCEAHRSCARDGRQHPPSLLAGTWVGGREGTTQFAGPERDISNRKGGKEGGG